MTIERYEKNPPPDDVLVNIAALRRLMGFWERQELDREVRARVFRINFEAIMCRLALTRRDELQDYVEEIACKRAERAWEAMNNEANPLKARIYENSLMQWLQIAERILGTDQ